MVPEGHKEIEILHIGSVELKDLGECEIEVYTEHNEERKSNIPQFRIYNNKIDSSICIETNTYTINTKNKLNKEQSEQLNQWLNEKERIFGDITNYEHIKSMWDICNPDNETINKEIPDYSNLN